MTVVVDETTVLVDAGPTVLGLESTEADTVPLKSDRDSNKKGPCDLRNICWRARRGNPIIMIFLSVLTFDGAKSHKPKKR